MSSAMFHTNSAIVRYSFEQNPFAVHLSNRVADASLDDVRAPLLQTNGCCTDPIVAHRYLAADALVVVGVDSGAAGVVNGRVVA